MDSAQDLIILIDTLCQQKDCPKIIQRVAGKANVFMDFERIFCYNNKIYDENFKFKILNFNFVELICLKHWERRINSFGRGRVVWKNGGPEEQLVVGVNEGIKRAEGDANINESFDEIYKARLIELIRVSRGEIFAKLRNIFGSRKDPDSMTTGELENLVLKQHGKDRGSDLLKREEEDAHREVSLARASYGESKEQQRASKDSMTGIWNKGYFMEVMKSELGFVGRNKEKGAKSTLVMCDLDHFTRINTQKGHLAGDDAINTFVRIVQKMLRREDVFTRYGGEEFAIILRGTDEAGAEEFVRRLHDEVNNKMALELGKKHGEMPSGTCTFSAGIMGITGDEQQTVLEVVEKADIALYGVKKLADEQNKTRDGTRVYSKMSEVELAKLAELRDEEKKKDSQATTLATIEDLPPRAAEEGGESIDTRTIDQIIADGAKKLDPEIAGLLPKIKPGNTEAFAKLIEILTQKRAA